MTYEILSGAQGAVVLTRDGADLRALPPVFADASDAHEFMRWHQQMWARLHLPAVEADARSWRTIRSWAPCHTSGCFGRRAPGHKYCEACEDERVFGGVA